MKSRLQEKYESAVIGTMQEKFSYKNPNQTPRVSKIVLNMGLGIATQNAKIVDAAVEEMTKICGQRAVPTRARVSVSNFKLREGQMIGSRVTLRRERMWEFLDRLVSVALPRVRDFRGVKPNGFDHRGTYNLGLRDISVFPEIQSEKLDRVLGLNISIVTTAGTDEEARELLRALGMPFRD